MSDQVFHELTFGSQRQFNGIRRKVQYFSTFAGGVIEALRELGFRLSNIEKQSHQPSSFGAHGQSSAQRMQAMRAAGTNISASSGGKNLELYFEQRDNDQCRVLIVPYRTDLPYLSKARFTAQLGLELSRYTSDPDVLRQAMNVNSRGQFGGFLGGMGGKTLPKLYLHSPPDIKQPGSMSFELRGARLVVAMNVLVDLGKYRLSDFVLDIPTIKADMEAYFYGLEKYLSLLLRNFGQDVEVRTEPPAPPEPPPLVNEAVTDNVEQPADEESPAPETPPPPTPTVPLATAQTVNLDPNQLPTNLAELEAPRKPRPIPESDRDEVAVGEPLQDISLPFDVGEEPAAEESEKHEPN